MIKIRGWTLFVALSGLLLVGCLFYLSRPTLLTAQESAYPHPTETLTAYLDWINAHGSPPSLEHTGNNNCQGCHTPPGNHYAGQCSNCHNTAAWLPASFDHTDYTDCQSCHTPPDNHFSGQCSDCHTTAYWREPNWSLFIPLLTVE